MSATPAELFALRQQRARHLCRELGLEGLLVTSRPNIRYLTGFSGSNGSVLVGPDSLTLVTDSRYREAIAAEQASGAVVAGLTVVIAAGTGDEAILDAAAGLSVVGVEAEHLTLARYSDLAHACQAGGRAVPVETEGLVESLRVRKDVHEQELLREAAVRISAVLTGVLEDVRTGRRERDVAQAIEAGLRRMGFDRPAFDTIVASGPASALPHARAGDRLLADGDTVVVDCGGMFEGYAADITRTVVMGAVDDRMRGVYDTVAAAHAAAVAEVRPGVGCGDVDRAARSVIAAAGLEEQFVHATGHGLGLDVHEAPRIGQPRPAGMPSPDRRRVPTPDQLEAGMVVTIEPGIYIPGVGGVRIEDDLLVTAEGCEILTTVSRALRVC